jgi:two-component system response regulator
MSKHSVPLILLVEDNEDDIELTSIALKQTPIANRLAIVRDGEEALRYLMRQGNYKNRSPHDDPALILLDLNLPKMDGLEVLRVLRAKPALAYLPVVVLTTSHEERDMVQSYKLGANSYILKPVDFAQFSDLMQQLSLYWMVLNKTPRIR